MSGVISDNVYRASGVIAAAGGGGKLVGFAIGQQPNETTINSTSYVSTGLTITYTPTDYSSNKIIVSLNGLYSQDDSDGQSSFTKILGTQDGVDHSVAEKTTGIDENQTSYHAISFCIEDTNLSSNLQVTYTYQAKGGNVTTDYRPRDITTLSVMEISA